MPFTRPPRFLAAVACTVLAGFTTGCTPLTAPGNLTDYVDSLRRVQRDPNPKNLVWHRNNLELLVNAAESRQLSPPPGLRVEYACLLAQQGKPEAAEEQLKREGAAYPDAVPFLASVRSRLGQIPPYRLNTTMFPAAKLPVLPAAVATTKGAQFPRMYEEKPVTVLVWPPINTTGEAEAAYYYSSTAGIELMRAGYYPLPVDFVRAVLGALSADESARLEREPISTLKALFHVDAVLMTTLYRWQPRDPISQNFEVDFHAALLSTQSSAVLWDSVERRTVGAMGSGDVGRPSGLPTAGVTAAVFPGLISPTNGAATASPPAGTGQLIPQDYMIDPTRGFIGMFKTLPVGKYHGQFMKDQAVAIDYQPGGSALTLPLGQAVNSAGGATVPKP